MALIDLGLPGLPGDQVARKIRREDPAVAAVLLTGWEIDGDDPRAEPFDLCARKPILLEELDEIVDRASAIHARRRAGAPGQSPVRTPERRKR